MLVHRQPHWAAGGTRESIMSVSLTKAAALVSLTKNVPYSYTADFARRQNIRDLDVIDRARFFSLSGRDSRGFATYNPTRFQRYLLASVH